MRIARPFLRFTASALAVAWLAACTPAVSGLEEVATRYRQNHEYDDLKAVSQQLAAGTASAEVERLLGEPDYCPTSGLCYYSSNRKARSADGQRDVSAGLVVDYRDGGSVTPKLQKSWLGPIEE